MNEGHDEKLQIAFHCVLPLGSLVAVPHDAADQETTVHVTIRIPVKHILGLIYTACEKCEELASVVINAWLHFILHENGLLQK